MSKRLLPLRKPNTLYQQSLKSVVHLLNETFKSIANKYRSYDVEECKLDVLRTKDFLSTHIPARIINDLYHKWGRSVEIKYDRRIGIASFLHENIKMIEVWYEERYRQAYHDKLFWDSQLCYCKRIVCLDFFGLCTDEMLDLVGRHCSSLEYIDIRSRSKNFKDSDGKIKCRSLVTDTGLKNLEICVKLKKIRLTKFVRRAKVEACTVSGIRRLLKCLPDIQVITFEDMGVVISDEMSDVDLLALTNIWDDNPKPSHIIAASRLCPNLQYLKLYFEEEENPSNIEYDNVSAVFETITSSSLCVSGYKISYFAVNESVFNFISVKGNFITHLSICIDRISTTLILSIGKYCKNMNIFNVDETYEEDLVEEDVSSDSHTAMFTKLQSFTLLGYNWDHKNILPMVLRHSKKLKKLEICERKRNNDDGIDNIINEILIENPLIRLRYFIASCNLRMKTIWHFFNIPSMKRLTLEGLSSFVSSSDKHVLIKEAEKYHIMIDWW